MNLKLKAELPWLTKKFEEHTEQIKAYIPKLKASKDYNVFEVRLAAECLYAYAREEMYSWCDCGATDAQINALGRAALKSLKLI